MKNNMLITIIALIIVGAIGFWGGMTYQKSQAPQKGGQSGQNAGGRFQGRNGPNGARPVAGEILSADDKSITVKLQDGSTKIVLLTDKTSINKAAQGSKSDLTAGQKVAAFGAENSDGSITATNIQLNPMMFRNGGPSPSPASK